jgi:DUF2934 family protein
MHSMNVNAQPILQPMEKTNQEEAQPVVQASESVAKIAERAYQLWQQRNCEHGNDLADWFQAERQINE